MSRFDKYAASISESIIQMTFMDEIKREKIVFLCVWFFLLEPQFLNTYSYLTTLSVLMLKIRAAYQIIKHIGSDDAI